MKVTLWLLAAAVCAALVVFGSHMVGTIGTSTVAIPTAKVRRGDLSLAITAKAELRGGDAETLTAPMTGGGEMRIVSLRNAGEQVKAGEVVVQLNTSEQEFKLKEAQADMAEAEQNVRQATAQREAEKEEDAYQLAKAKSDLKIAELDVKKNPLLPAITARQNDLALEAARDHLAQLEHNIANRQQTGDAGIAMQQAARAKAEAAMKTAKDNIEAMTIRAHRAGYVSLKTAPANFISSGMVLPPFQTGDTAQPGMAIAEIPDLSHWEIAASMDELDRGHIAIGDKAEINVIAVPGHKFHGKVKDLGGTTGNFWERHFECKFSLDDPVPELRPGMSALVVMTTDELRNVLWLPAQALFDENGRQFVYLKSGKSFVQKDVKLVRRNETRAVITGVNEGQEVAMANPAEVAKKGSTAANPLQSIQK